MNKLFTQDAAIKYLREQCGQMSLKVFTQEVERMNIQQQSMLLDLNTISNQNNITTG